jgi:hypothetical protein
MANREINPDCVGWAEHVKSWRVQYRIDEEMGWIETANSYATEEAACQYAAQLAITLRYQARVVAYLLNYWRGDFINPEFIGPQQPVYNARHWKPE